MKSLKMGKMLGSIRRRNTSGNGAEESSEMPNGDGDGPVASATRHLKAFCEGSGPNTSGDEVLHLPPIVDAAESSPQAAAECARLIRKYLKKDNWSRPAYQYNAIMILRILVDNPGQSFTRNLDQKFVDIVKELLRFGRDPSVRGILMETLESFEFKTQDEGVGLLADMWKKEKEKEVEKYRKKHGPNTGNQYVGHQTQPAQPVDAHSQNYFARNHTNPRLPNPAELASRLEEANTSAKLLQQVVTNTPPAEVLMNDLIKEFANRCTSASRSMQLYMTAEDPSPDNETMENLIDTNERLQAALSLHQRAMLNARKQAGEIVPEHPAEGPVPALNLPLNHAPEGSSRRPSPNAPTVEEDDYDAPPVPPRKLDAKGKGREYDSAVAGPSRGHTPAPPEEDPFRDPNPEPGHHDNSSSGYGAYLSRREDDHDRDNEHDHDHDHDHDEPRLANEPYHPGFKTTPSYVHRQDSAINKETMHGAVPLATEAGPAPRQQPEETDEDLYEAPPKSKDPMYRY